MRPVISEGPASPWLNWNASISNIKAELSGVITYTLTIDDEEIAKRYEFLPGQFNMIYLPGFGEAAISISGESDGTGNITSDSCEETQSPSGSQPSSHYFGLQHTIREAGSVTQALTRMKEGDGVALRGPFGSAWPMAELLGKDVILVAGGIGMAPLRPVIRHILGNREHYGDVFLLQGARSSEGLLYEDELPIWKDAICVQRTVDRADSDWSGDVGVVTALIERLELPRPAETVLLTCGPEAMMWYTIRTAQNRGISESSMWVSLERNMNCAVGFCGHCQLGPQFICKDGPIFRYDHVAPLLQVDEL